MERLLVYLDQNIISAITNDNFAFQAGENISFIYSKEHFSEILRSKEPLAYVDALEKINARQINLILNNWEITNNASIDWHSSVHKNFIEYKESIAGYKNVEEIFHPLQAWLNGGQNEGEVIGIPTELDIQLNKLLSPFYQEQLENSQKIEIGATANFTSTISEILSYPNDINKTREAFGVGKGAIGDFHPETALLDIWNILPIKPEGLTIEQFYGFSAQDWAEKKEIPVYLGIVSCNAVLDLIGFQAEKKIRKTANMPNVFSDANHIAMASFCSGLITKDRRLANRAKAIYSFLKIPTQVLHIE